MELRYYLSTLGRRKFEIFVVTLLTTLVVIVATTWWIPTTYKAGLFFTLSYRDDQVTDEYKYGNFHATMAAVEFGRTFSGWTKNPKLVDEIYLRAGVNQSEDEGLLGKLLGPLSTNRIERANIQITLRSKSAENADKLISALQTVMEEKLEEYNTLSATKYKINNPSKAYETQMPELGTNIPIGIVVGLLLGMLFAYLYEYFSGVVTSVTEAETLIGREKTDLISRHDGSTAYSFLASLILAKHKQNGVVFAGININPAPFTLRLARNLAKQHDGILVVDAHFTKRNLHNYVKGHRKMKKGITDAKTPVAALKAAYDVSGESFTILPAGTEKRVQPEIVSGLARQSKILTVFHTQIPDNAEVLNFLPDALIVPVVQLGRSKSDDVRKLHAFFKDKDTHLLIIT